MKLRYYLADVLFFAGHSLVRWSALLMGYKDTARELKNSKEHWLQTEAFKTKNF